MKRLLCSLMFLPVVLWAVSHITINGAKFKVFDIDGPIPPGFNQHELAMLNWNFVPAPGGITDPRDINGLAFWMDGADNDGGFDGGTGDDVSGDIDIWHDKSGNNFDGTTPGAAPDYEASVQNSLACVDFESASSEYFDLGDQDAFSCDTGCTMFFVAQTPATLGTQRLLSKETSSTSGLEWAVTFPGFTTGNNEVNWMVFGDATSSTSWHGRSDNDQLSTSTTYIFMTSYNGGTAGSTDLRIHFNGTLDTDETEIQAGNSMPPDNSASSLRIGARYSTPAVFFNGKICEVGMYDEEISDASVADLFTYLNNKWAVY